MKQVLATLFIILLSSSKIYSMSLDNSLNPMTDEEFQNLLNEKILNMFDVSDQTSAVQMYGSNADDGCVDQIKPMIQDIKEAITLYQEKKYTLLTLKVNKIIAEFKNKVVPNCQNLINCVLKDQDEVKMIIQLVKDIQDGKIIATIDEIFSLLGRVGKLLKNCPIFCYGPTFKKCQRENPGNPCEMNGLIVYPVCAPGYTNWGCCVCANVCPAGFRDDGLYCFKPSSYGRGVGYPLWEEGKCNRENPNTGCEKWGAIWYPRCIENFHNVACCICSPNCPPGWTDIGISCQKPNTYGRGVGYPVTAGLACLLD